MNTLDASGGDTPRVSRRRFTTSLAALALTRRAFAQPEAIRLRKLNGFEIRVPDVESSVAFYQGLFGMPVQARAEGAVSLRIGAGPQFMRIRRSRAGEAPGITHLAYAVEDYDPERLQAALRGRGFEPIEAPPVTAAGVDHAMSTWISARGQAQDLYFADRAGLIVQLTDPDYCGGAGADGERCGAAEPAPEGLLELEDLNHFTVFVDDGAAANRFYQELFGLSVQAWQGPQAPVIGLGDGRQFVMYAGAPGGGSAPANIHHGCFNMQAFDVDRVRETLTRYGLAARGDGPTGPLMHYVSLRMPERGGAEGGTPELYFTDPDGILLQLQHVSYCGGGGYLGNECLA